MNQSIHIWQLENDGTPLPLALEAQTLDEVSRRLPQGLYSTFRTFAGRTRVLDLRHHLERLYRPAAQMNIRPSVEENILRRVLADVLRPEREVPGTFGGRARSWRPQSKDEARVRVSLSTEKATAGALFVAIEPLKSLSDALYQHGVRVVTSQLERANPGLKSTAFIRESEQARKSLADSGVFEALMLHNGRILEGLTSNFYYVSDGVLGTAGRGVLPGVTRRLVLRLARADGLQVVYRALRTEGLDGIDEAFLTSSSRGILPVVQVDDLRVGQGLPGPLTRRLMERYEAYVEKHAGLIRP